MININEAEDAKSGTLVAVRYDEWDLAIDLIDANICQMTRINGVRTLEVL